MAVRSSGQKFPSEVQGQSPARWIWMWKSIYFVLAATIVFSMMIKTVDMSISVASILGLVWHTIWLLITNTFTFYFCFYLGKCRGVFLLPVRRFKYSHQVFFYITAINNHATSAKSRIWVANSARQQTLKTSILMLRSTSAGIITSLFQHIWHRTQETDHSLRATLVASCQEQHR